MIEKNENSGTEEGGGLPCPFGHAGAEPASYLILGRHAATPRLIWMPGQARHDEP